MPRPRSITVSIKRNPEPPVTRDSLIAARSQRELTEKAALRSPEDNIAWLLLARQQEPLRRECWRYLKHAPLAPRMPTLGPWEKLSEPDKNRRLRDARSLHARLTHLHGHPLYNEWENNFIISIRLFLEDEDGRGFITPRQYAVLWKLLSLADYHDASWPAEPDPDRCAPGLEDDEAEAA